MSCCSDNLSMDAMASRCLLSLIRRESGWIRWTAPVIEATRRSLAIPRYRTVWVQLRRGEVTSFDKIWDNMYASSSNAIWPLYPSKSIYRLHQTSFTSSTQVRCALIISTVISSGFPHVQHNSSSSAVFVIFLNSLSTTPLCLQPRFYRIGREGPCRSASLATAPHMRLSRATYLHITVSSLHYSLTLGQTGD
jgi:hypothetical protein